MGFFPRLFFSGADWLRRQNQITWLYRRIMLDTTFPLSGSHSFSIRSPAHASAAQGSSLHSPLYARRSTQTRPPSVDVGTNTSLPGCMNGRSPDLPANPVTWSVKQVVQYVRSTDCGNYAGIFFDQVSSLRLSHVLILVC